MIGFAMPEEEPKRPGFRNISSGPRTVGDHLSGDMCRKAGELTSEGFLCLVNGFIATQRLAIKPGHRESGLIRHAI